MTKHKVVPVIKFLTNWTWVFRSGFRSQLHDNLRSFCSLSSLINKTPAAVRLLLCACYSCMAWGTGKVDLATLHTDI